MATMGSGLLTYDGSPTPSNYRWLVSIPSAAYRSVCTSST